jgi:predicted porin
MGLMIPVHFSASEEAASDTQSYGEAGKDDGILFHDSFLDRGFDAVFGWRDKLNLPITAGAWHWYHLDIGGDADGYGPPGLRGTYYWFLTATPEFDLTDETRIGAHVEYRFRDSNDGYRSFFEDTLWFYEGYGYFKNDSLGTLKIGQVEKKFGLTWAFGFWPTTSNFDGYMQDPDYGLSWEKSTRFSDSYKLDSVVQFLAHEDGINGTFEGSDPESVIGIKERNTGVIRLVPEFQLSNDSSLALGLNLLAGEIDSDRSDFKSSVNLAWGIDAVYLSDHWRIHGEIVQTFGKRVPVRFTSGGASNRITDVLAGGQYRWGPASLYADYSLGFDDNPASTHEIIQVGTSVQLTKYVTFYLEYVHEDVKGNAAVDNIEFFDGIEFVLFWSF